MKLVLILATGVVFYPHQGNFTDHPYLELARKWIFAAQSWLTGPSEKSTVSLDGLQVFCLLLLARQACGLGPSPWLSSGSLLKMAMAMGLHWNPASFPSLSVFHSEMRARLWATVLELIVQSSLDSGTPISLPENFDDKGPKNIDDQNISPDSSTAPVPQRNDQVTDTSIQILLRRSLKLRIDVIRVIGDRSGQSYRTVLQLGAELRNVCRELASFFNSNMPGYSFPQLRPTNFHRIFLDTQIRRYILFLYKPFMVQARWEPRYYYARKTCLESATIIASYADRVDLPNGELDDLSRLFILGKGPFKGPLSLDILSVIGFEIINQLEEEAPAQPSTLPAADPLDELSKANRAPLIRRLEHIRDQLRQIIALGTPSMKRYNLFAAMIGQIQAMESGQSVKSAVYETLRHTLKDSHALLEANTSPAQGSIHALVGGPNDNPPDSLTGLDMNLVVSCRPATCTAGR